MSTTGQVAFRDGDTVTVRTGNPPTHYRTPVYVQGKTGRVVALCGVFPDPESLAHGGDGTPYKPLYRVEFPQTDLWEHYSGPATDRLQVDIYEQWLERVA
jgi:nitrile hydratase